VPSGALTALPFQVLVNEKPSAAIPADTVGYANAAWLARRHAITVLPSVASLKTLRQFAKPSKATEPYIGFGNPLLTGPDGRDRRAWARQTCKAPQQSAQAASRRVRSAIAKFFRSGLANVEEIRAQEPLPETADELCAVAQSAGVGDDKVYLGEKASELAIKALSAEGTLARARVVHFATHGLLEGETEMFAAAKAEPALVLTPPAQASEENDGLLTASEIAHLKLDADWVVLSACNTAVGESDKPGAEALSGLARGFFYAGARALLVSHWAVNSEATVKLITKGFAELSANPEIGRAEAMRRSMLMLISQGVSNSHPANWGPFVVVGEGGQPL
jgi:CHAT domain-containing protein